NRSLFGWEVPTIMFASLYPLAVIVAAPFVTMIWSYLASRKREPAAPIKLAMSLIFASVAFSCFLLAALSTNSNITSHLPVIWILLGNLGLGIGEVCLMPVMLSTISRLAPA